MLDVQIDITHEGTHNGTVPVRLRLKTDDKVVASRDFGVQATPGEPEEAMHEWIEGEIYHLFGDQTEGDKAARALKTTLRGKLETLRTHLQKVKHGTAEALVTI